MAEEVYGTVHCYCRTTNDIRSIALPGEPPSTEVKVSVPEADVTVPALQVAVVGTPVAPTPRLVITAVAPTMVLAAVKVRVAGAVLLRLKPVRRTVWPMVPTTLHPLDEVMEATPVG